MKLEMYGLKDNVEGEFIFFFQAKNEGIMKRAVEGALLDKNGNHFTNNMKDKAIYNIGTIETLTGAIQPISPVFVSGVNEIRLDLIKKIKIAKAEQGDVKPDANEVASDE